MRLNINNVFVEIDQFSEDDFEKVHCEMIENMKNRKVKNRDIIKNSFFKAISLAPRANPSDLWHHIIYRMYLKELPNYRIVSDVGQSWKRASGDAFEFFLMDYYNLLLKDTDVRLITLSTCQPPRKIKRTAAHNEKTRKNPKKPKKAVYFY